MTTLTPQEAFVNEQTRVYLVSWCDSATRASSPSVQIPDDLTPYRLHAESKGWLSAKNRTDGSSKILAAGWRTASAFLKR